MKSRLRSLFLGDALVGPSILAIGGVWLSLSVAMGTVTVPASWWLAASLTAIAAVGLTALVFIALRLSAAMRPRTAELAPNRRH